MSDRAPSYALILPFSIGTLEQLMVRFLIYAIANSGKQIKDRGVADQPHNVASPDQHGCATFAPFEMLVHPSAQVGTDLILQVIRDLTPYLGTADFHCLGPASFHPSSKVISQRSRRRRLSLPPLRKPHYVFIRERYSADPGFSPLHLA